MFLRVTDRATLRDCALREAGKDGGPGTSKVAEVAYVRVDRIMANFAAARSIGIALGLVGGLIVCIVAVGWLWTLFAPRPSDGTWLEAGLSLATAFFGGGFCLFASWPIIIWLERKFGWVPEALKSPRLAPYHRIRRRCADGALVVRNDAGHPLGGLVFDRLWSLILFSDEPRHRAFRLEHTTGLILEEPEVSVASFDRGSIAKREQRPGSEAVNVSIVLNYLSAVLNEGTTIINFASEPHSSPKPRRKKHWFAGVNEALFSARFETIASHWDGLKEQQILVALKTAFNFTRQDRNPHASVKEICREVQHAFAEHGLPPSLGKSKDGKSDAALKKLFEAGDQSD
jgi:hypothetical protein